MAKGKNRVVTEFSDGDSLKKLEKKVKKTSRGFDALATSQRSADRAGKGITGQSSNQTKNFSKIQQGISGGLVPAYATLAAQVFAVTAAFQFLSSAIDYKNLIAGQEAFGAVTGIAFQTYTKGIQEATGGQLRFAEAAQATAIGIAAGLSRAQLEEIGTAAKNTSLALGRDLTDSFNRLTRGITKAEPELLDELGIILRLEPALKAYADSVGKSKEQLNQFEKSQAVANEVLGQAEMKFGRITEIMDPSAFALQQFAVAFDDLLNRFKVLLGSALLPMIQFLSNNVPALTAALSLFALPIIKTILPNFDEMGKRAKENFGIVQKQIQKTQGKMLMMTGDNKGFRESSSTAINDLRSREGLKPVSVMHGQMTRRSIDAQMKELKRGGKLRDMLNAKERAQYKRHLRIQLLSLEISEKKKRGEFQKTATFFNLQTQKMELQYRKAQVRMITFSQFAAKQMNRAFMAAGVIGALVLIGSLVVSAFKAIRGESPFKAINDDIQAATETQKGLNKELAKMLEVRKEGLIAQGQETSLQFANMLKSAGTLKSLADFEANRRAIAKLLMEKGATQSFISAQTNPQIKDIMEQRTSMSNGPYGGTSFETVKVGEETTIANKNLNKQFQEQRETLATLRDAAVGPLKKEYAALYDQFLRGEPITKDQAENIRKLEGRFIGMADRVAKASEVNKTYQQSLTGMAGKGLPFQNQRRALNDMMRTVEAQITMEKEGVENESERTQKSKDQLATDRARLQVLQNFKVELGEIVDKEVERLETLEANNRARSIASRAVTIEDKLLHLNTKNLKAEEKSLKVKQDLRNAQASLNALEQKGYKTTSEFMTEEGVLDQAALDAYVENGGILEENVKDAEFAVDLAREKVSTAETELRTTELLTEEQRKQLKIQLNNLALKQRQNLMDINSAKRSAGRLGFNTAFAGTQFGSFALKQQGIRDAQTKAARMQLSIDTQRQNLMDKNIARSSQEFQTELSSIHNNEAKLKLLKEQTRFQEEALTLGGQLQNSFAKGMEDMFTAFFTGAKTAKEAFADLAMFMLKKMAEIAAQQVAMSIMTNMFGLTIPMARGGVIRGYRGGGIATEPTYLVGEGKHNEAVVPLPDGRSIPVSMTGGGANNNISINIDNSGNASSTGMNGAQGAALGKAIAATVMETIQREKRPGGVLSR